MSRQQGALSVPGYETGNGPGQSSRDVADYIASLTEQMALMARTHRLDMLAYLLDMARIEAEQLARSSARDH